MVDTQEQCQWFALCTNQATGTQSHAILGEVPICDRCKARYDRDCQVETQREE